MSLDYFYDAQIRRYLIQIARIFIGFQYAYKDTNNKTVYKTVPLTYASTNAQVANIINDNTENKLQTIPIFSLYMTDIKQDHTRRQDPSYVKIDNVTEREIVDGKYTSNRGNSYGVEMLMPVPYTLTAKIDLITSNETQKLQILEQILVLFNPEVELQTSTNAIDWTALTTIKLTDINITPAANKSTINDVTTLTFSVPIYINPPAKIKKESMIKEIIMNIGDLSRYNKDVDLNGDKFDSGAILHNSVVTPGNLYINIERCYTNRGVYYINLSDDVSGNTSKTTWKDVFNIYGEFKNNETLVYILYNKNSISIGGDNFYVGKLRQISDTDDKMILTIDTNTIPHTRYKDNIITDVFSKDCKLPTTNEQGTTLLLLDNIDQNTKQFGTIYYNNIPTNYGNYGAYQNDIIKWDGTKWNIVFSASENIDNTVYYTNIKNGDYLTFIEGGWRMSIDGIYAPGYWRIDLQ